MTTTTAFNAITVLLEGPDKRVEIRDDQTIVAQVCDLSGKTIPDMPSATTGITEDLKVLKRAGVRQVLMVAVHQKSDGPKQRPVSVHLAHMSEAPNLGLSPI